MSLPTIPADTIDDLIYDARAGDLDSLKTTLSQLSTQLQCSPAQIIAATIDAAPEAEGGTGCCLLHYPAANGNLGPSPLPTPCVLSQRGDTSR